MGRHNHGQNPCASPGKRPLVAWEPYQSRLPTDQEARSWWSRWPSANIGMATGALSGIVVLDCDSGDARQLAMERGGVDRTPAVFTGKPGGVHYWLEHPIDEVRNFARKLPGLDFRGDGGYVLLPPSLHSSGARYRWAGDTVGRRASEIPPWLWELIRGGSSETANDPAQHEPLDVEDMLRGFKEGHRDDGLFKLACRFRHDDEPQVYAEALIRVAAQNCDPSFPGDDAVRKVRYVYRRYAAGNVGPELLDEGWFSPPGAQAEPVAEKPPHVFLRPISELLEMPEVEPDWLVDRLFTVGSNGWVAAEPKVGKSWVLLELAYALSTGSPFLGRFAVKQPRRIVYIQEEDSLQRVLRRLKQLIKGDALREPPSNENFKWSIREGFKLDNPAWMETLRGEIELWNPDVVFMDVFNRLHGSDENKQQEMTPILNMLTGFTKRYGCSFILVHHNRKPQPGGEARPNQLIRGSGVLAGWSECSLYLRKGKDKDTMIITPESKDVSDGDEISVTLLDTDNGGVVLQIDDVEPVGRLSKSDAETIEAVQAITNRGIGATAKAAAECLGRDRSTVQTRLTRLVEAGYLSVMAVSDVPNATKIYTVTQ